MLTRFISAFVHSQRPLTTISPRLFNTSVPKLGDGDHTHSHGKYKAYDDLKSGQEKRWLDTVASDSEAAVRSEREKIMGHVDMKVYMNEIQLDTIEAIKDKESKGHLHTHNSGRGDTREERIGT